MFKERRSWPCPDDRLTQHLCCSLIRWAILDVIFSPIQPGTWSNLPFHVQFHQSYMSTYCVLGAWPDLRMNQDPALGSQETVSCTEPRHIPLWRTTMPGRKNNVEETILKEEQSTCTKPSFKMTHLDRYIVVNLPL